MTNKCWHRTGPVTFCGRIAEHTIHHVQPDTFRFHPFQAKPRMVTEVKYREKAAIEREAGVTADRVYVADLGGGDSQTDALVRACHERNIYSPVDLAAALRPTHPLECPRCQHPWAHHVCYTHGRGQCQCPDLVSPVTASRTDAK